VFFQNINYLVGINLSHIFSPAKKINLLFDLSLQSEDLAASVNDTSKKLKLIIIRKILIKVKMQVLNKYYFL